MAHSLYPTTDAEIEAGFIVSKNIEKFGKIHLSAASSFQRSAARWSAFARDCEHTGSGPGFREAYEARAALEYAIARLIILQD